MSLDINSSSIATKGKRTFRNLRWWVLSLFLLGVTVNYITRNSLGILAPELKTSMGITTEQYSGLSVHSNWRIPFFSRFAAG